ncbi:hypothetical protein [Extibacter sp. GGCC_0201]|nr:hypothetical protein [Extibacter sp. GGCC_0201]
MAVLVSRPRSGNRVASAPMRTMAAVWCYWPAHGRWLREMNDKI